MKFSYTAVWNDTVALMRSHGSLLLAIAGVFIFLPLLLTGYLLPAPTSNADPFGALRTYYSENFLWLALGSLVNAIGSIAIYRLLFADGRLSVGQAIGGGLPLLPFYFIMTVLVSIAIGAGLALFILPGIYLLGRLIAAAPAMVAGHQFNPLSAVAESWRVSKRRGWAVAGLVVIVGVAGSILAFVLTIVFGSVFLLLGDVGKLLGLIVSAAVNSVFYTVLIVLLAAIYRALRGGTAPAETSGI